MRHVKACDIIDARMRRAALQMSLQRLKCRLWTLRNYFNRTIWKVLYVPAEFQSLRLTHDKPPEPHALNAPPDDPAPQAQTDSGRPRGRRGAAAATEHINPDGNQRQRYQDQQRPRDVPMNLCGAQRSFVLAQEVSDPGEDRAPHSGAGGRIQDELGERHPMQSRGNRDEVPDHGEQPPDQGADLPMLREEPLRAQQVLLAQ